MARENSSGEEAAPAKSFSEQIQEAKERNTPSWMKSWNANSSIGSSDTSADVHTYDDGGYDPFYDTPMGQDVLEHGGKMGYGLSDSRKSPFTPLVGANGKPISFMEASNQVMASRKASSPLSSDVARSISDPTLMDELQGLSNALHVKPMGMARSYYQAQEGMRNASSWDESIINGGFVAATFLPAAAEEALRGILNIPSAFVGAFPAASRMGENIGIASDSRLPTDQRVIGGLGAIQDFSQAFTGLGAPATFIDPQFSFGGPNVLQANRTSRVNAFMEPEANFAGNLGNVRTVSEGTLTEHMVKAELASNGKSIYGGHNMENFNQILTINNGTILSKVETSPSSGIFQIEYTLPNSTKSQLKTVYDPVQYPNMSTLTNAAAQKALGEYQLNGYSGSFTFDINIGGVKFAVPVNPGSKTNPAPKVPTVYPKGVTR